MLLRRCWLTSGGHARLDSRADRKPVEGRQRLHGRLNVTEIDFGLEERDFVVQSAFVEVDVP